MNLGIGLGLGFGGAPAAAFVPTNLNGIELWLRADKGVTIATGVSVWADQSGTGDANKNATQATGAQQPTRNAADASYNNRTTFSFLAGSNQHLVTGTFASPLPQPSTLMIVGDMQNAAAGAYFIDGLGSDRNALLGAGASTLTAYAGASLSASGVAPASPNVWVVVWNGASSKIFCSAKTAVANGDVSTQGVTGYTIGERIDGSLGPFTGKIAEIVAYGRALSDAEVAQLLTYAGTRYGISIGV